MLTIIPEHEFSTANPIFRLIAHDHAHKFGILRLPYISYSFLLSWRSDQIEPIIEIDSFSSVWVGIDQRVACVSSNGNVLFSIGLDGVLLQIKHLQLRTVIICDIELIVVNQAYSIQQIRHLPALTQSFAIDGNNLTVYFINGEQMTVSI